MQSLDTPDRTYFHQRHSSVCHSLALLLSLIILSMHSALFAQDIDFGYTIEVHTENGVPVEGVQILGTNGVEDLNGKITDTNGTWEFDRRDLTGSGEAIFTFYREGYRFSPPEISLAECTGRICDVVAIPSSLETTPVRVTVVDQNGNGVSGLPVHVSQSHTTCERRTDNDGIAIFSVDVRNISACSDTDSNSNNDFSTVFVTPPFDGSCTIRPIANRNLCITTGGVREVVVRADCPSSPTAPTALP
ncbi:MAG: Ig-like domain-containing protein, partial [Bdellovibrionales bacterium]|nr:Ig-like domain-containing protein [Bdellovibrionales bacterium]